MTDFYLSRLELNLGDRQVRRDVASPYELHRTVMRAFDGDREATATLHRLESHPHHDGPVLLVQSAEAPDWSFLDNEGGYLLPPAAAGPNPATKPVALRLHAGQVLRFRLRANPTVKKKRDGRHSNRVPLFDPAQQQAWLARQADRHGFELLRLETTNDRAESGAVRPATDNQPLTLYSVRFDGLLRVTEPDRLLTAVQSGIGPAKAFGCGLLSLAPA